MPNYDKPPMNNIPFEFTTGGYTKPDFSEVPFQFGLRPTFQQTADLQAAINVISQSTADLSASIQGVTRQRDLGAYIKSTIQTTKNLGASVVGHLPVDLAAYIKSTIQAYKNLGASVYSIPPVDLAASLTGILFKSTGNLLSTIYGIPPRDLLASIFGYLPIDLPATIIAWYIKDLAGYVNAVYRYDLQAFIQSTTTANLGGSLFSIQPVDLQGLLHGWAISDLAATLVGGYGPYDIQASLNPIPSQNLSAIIRGWKGFQIPIDLPASVSSWAITDLSAVISLIEAADLGASITAIGKLANLGAIIIPKTILMKRALQISLLEHKDMKAVINFQCFGSAYNNLGASMYTIYKSELKAFITGWYSGGTADTIRDLGAYINAEDYYVEDKFTVTFVPAVRKYTQLNINFSVNDVYKTFDTLPII